MTNYLNLLTYIYIAIVGAVIGSFLNVVIYRVPKHISVAKGRSFCPNCKHQLSTGDLFPFISWILLRGKCRYCKTKIPFRYFFVELLGAVFAITSFAKYGVSWASLFAFAFFSVIICISFVDLDTLEIPNGFLLFLIAPTAFFSLTSSDISLINRAIGFFTIALPMFLMTIIISDCFGGGDIKLIAVCGFLLGWQNTLLAAFIAIVLGGVYGSILLATKSATKKSHFAFGPFLCFGVAVAFLYGNNIISFYLNLF